MAWVEKYRLEFNDIYGVLWTRKIYEDGFGGSKTDLIGTGNPLIYEFLSASDDFDEPIRETKGTSEVYAITNFALADLYSTEEMHFLVEDYVGATLYFKGYVNAGNCAESYSDTPYPVSIPAICGLSYLKNIKYDDSGTYYTGRKLLSQILLDILGKIGFTTFTEYINIYETSMDKGQTDSIFDQTLIDVDMFKELYCYDVLTEILKPFSAVIRQVNGTFVIYRPVEFKETTIYGRTFTAATTKTGTSITPQAYINRSTNASNILQLNDSVQMIVNPVSSVKLYQDYINKESWIKNYYILKGSYDSGAGEYQNWTKGASWTRISISGIDKGITLQNTGGTTPPSGTFYVSQSFGVYAVNSSDAFVFSFEYLTSRAGALISGVYFYMRIKSDSANQYLKVYDESTCVWDTNPALIAIQINVPAGVSEWTTFSRVIASIPTTGSYTITLWGLDTASACFILYNNIRFYSTSDELAEHIYRKSIMVPNPYFIFLFPVVRLNIRGKKRTSYSYYDKDEVTARTYEKTNAISGEAIERQYILGDVSDVSLDNVIEQLGGSLASQVTTLQYRVDEITLSGATGDANITCNGVTKLATFDSDLNITASDFVTLWAADYLAVGIVLTASGSDLIFTSNVLGAEFTGTTSITNVTPDLDGSASTTTPASVVTIDYTTNWSTRGGSEDKELLSVVCDEIAAQHARPRQLIQMSCIDKNASDVSFGLLKRYEDDLNQYSGNNRKFITNAGEFKVKQRELTIDLIEII